jgi:hypothetical protein
MSGSDRPEQAIEDAVFTDAGAPCVALVPVVAPAEWKHTVSLPRPNSIFVTQLIATAEQAPQTRHLRRATAADAQTAYTHQHRIPGAGVRTRQVI